MFCRPPAAPGHIIGRTTQRGEKKKENIERRLNPDPSSAAFDATHRALGSKVKVGGLKGKVPLKSRSFPTRDFFKTLNSALRSVAATFRFSEIPKQ